MPSAQAISNFSSSTIYEEISFAIVRSRSDSLACDMRRYLGLALACMLSVASCVTYAEELNRGQRYFQANEYERALAVWRILEENVDSLSATDRTRYAYLRGMTDYRMSLRADARHWLAVARAYEQVTPGGIEEGWRDRMKEALKDLDNDVHGGGENLGADAGVK
jgi:hypothetical protein